ncbi:MAG TPA: aspartate aminotransferase family protein, partial [Ruminococcaceae bacterium]|nr:aspartate aminotransferase family protein [Oscillospiraceae bacterium]
MSKLSMYERCKKVMPPVAKRATTLGVVRGRGCYLTTEDGRKILDFASGVAVCNLGHNHPAVVRAAAQQMQELIHGGHNVVYYESYVRLAEKLVEATGGDTMVYFSNSGAEANEGAI